MVPNPGIWLDPGKSQDLVKKPPKSGVPIRPLIAAKSNMNARPSKGPILDVFYNVPSMCSVFTLFLVRERKRPFFRGLARGHTDLFFLGAFLPRGKNSWLEGRFWTPFLNPGD